MHNDVISPGKMHIVFGVLLMMPNETNKEKYFLLVNCRAFFLRTEFFLILMDSQCCKQYAKKSFRIHFEFEFIMQLCNSKH